MAAESKFVLFSSIMAVFVYAAFVLYMKWKLKNPKLNLWEVQKVYFTISRMQTEIRKNERCIYCGFKTYGISPGEAQVHCIDCYNNSKLYHRLLIDEDTFNKRMIYRRLITIADESKVSLHKLTEDLSALESALNKTIVTGIRVDL